MSSSQIRSAQLVYKIQNRLACTNKSNRTIEDLVKTMSASQIMARVKPSETQAKTRVKPAATLVKTRVKLTLFRIYTTNSRHIKMKQCWSQEKKVLTLMEICLRISFSDFGPCMKSCRFLSPLCSIEMHYWFWLCRSLSDVLLLKENDYSDKQLEHFGSTTSLEKIKNAVVDQYVDSNVKFDQISEILRVRLV